MPKTTSNLTMNIPSFLYDEIVALLKRKNQDANMRNVQNEVNVAIMTYIIQSQSDDALKEDLFQYREILKEGFYKLSYLVSKSFCYDLIKDSQGTKYEHSMSELDSMAEENATQNMQELLSFTSKGATLKEKEQELKSKIAKPRIYKG